MSLIWHRGVHQHMWISNPKKSIAFQIILKEGITIKEMKMLVKEKCQN